MSRPCGKGLSRLKQSTRPTSWPSRFGATARAPRHETWRYVREESTLNELLALVRPAVAASHVYKVPSYGGITAKLNQNESPFDLPAEIKRKLVERFLEESWNRYPDEFGETLRLAIAERVGWHADGILLGNGSNELAQYLGFALIQPGTPVVLLDPMFSLFAKIVELHEGFPITVRCEDDFTTDADKVISTAREAGAVLTIVATPNNPTGRSIPYDDLVAIAEAIPGILLVDEAYHEFVDGPEATDLLHAHPNVLVMRTLSKTVGLAGLRLGYLLGQPVLITEFLKARLPFMINRLTAVVAEYLIRNPAMVSERAAALKTSRDELAEALAEMDDVQVVPSDTNFVIFRTPLESVVVERGLAARGVLVRNVSSYVGMERFVRVNAGLDAENKAFLSALKDVLSAT